MLTSAFNINIIAHIVLRDSVHVMSQNLLYFKKIACFQAVGINVIYFYPVRKLRSSRFRFARNSALNNNHICNKNQQNSHFFSLMIQFIYIVLDIFRSTKCSSSRRFVHAILWYQAHPAIDQIAYTET